MITKTRQLEVQNLFIYPKGNLSSPLVSDLSFHLNTGESLAIVGESGSGKTLTAMTIPGLLPEGLASEGEVRFRRPQGWVNLNGWTWRDPRWRAIRGKEIGLVFQEPMTALNPIQTLGDQLKEAIAVHHSEREAMDRVFYWMDKVRLPDPKRFYHRYPHQVSGGQKQRLVIAMAMCHQPRLLIADEPTTALDMTIQREVVTLMQSLASESGTAILFITHDLGLAVDMADQVLLLYQGRSLAMGTAEQVLIRGEHEYARRLMDARPSPEMKGKRLPVDQEPNFNDPRLNDPALSGVEDPLSLGGEWGGKPPLIRVRGLEVQYTSSKGRFRRAKQELKVLDNIDFDLYAGEILGLVGESGSGKTSLGRALLGLTPAHRGQIQFAGRDLATLGPREWMSLRSRIQMIFQDPYSSLNPRRSIRQTIEEPMILHLGLSRRQREEEMRRLLDEVGLPSSVLNRYPHEFSGGQRQRLAIARALASRPVMLVCDECVSALDLRVQAQILNLLSTLRREKGLAMLFISHDLSVVQYISDRVLVLHQGQIVEDQDAVSLFLFPKHSYTQSLIQAMPGTGTVGPGQHKMKDLGRNPPSGFDRSSQDGIFG